MAHKTYKNVAKFLSKTRPNKKARKHPAQSKRDKIKFLMDKLNAGKA